MLRDTLVGLIEPMLASAGADPFRARCHPSGTEYRMLGAIANWSKLVNSDSSAGSRNREVT